MNLQSILLFMDSIWSWWYGTKGGYYLYLLFFVMEKLLSVSFKALFRSGWMVRQGVLVRVYMFIHLLIKDQSGGIFTVFETNEWLSNYIANYRLIKTF